MAGDRYRPGQGDTCSSSPEASERSAHPRDRHLRRLRARSRLAGSLPPDGRVITLELDPRHAAVARSNFERAGLSGSDRATRGRRSESLAAIERAQEGPFDVFFIDADWVSHPRVLHLGAETRPTRQFECFDNVVRDGAILDSHCRDATVRATRELHERLGSEPRVLATALQTVGEKGHDGFALALVVADSKGRMGRRSITSRALIAGPDERGSPVLFDFPVTQQNPSLISAEICRDAAFWLASTLCRQGIIQ